MRKWLVIVGIAALAGCVGEDPSTGDPVGERHAPLCSDADGDGFGTGCPAGNDCNDTDPYVTNECRGCATPDTNCACDPVADAPVPCYLDPSDVGGVLVCHEGVRYCRDTRWTSCLEIHSYDLQGEPGAARAALIDGPTACNPCDPLCAISRDYPTAGDLTPGNSTNVTYDPLGGGITLTDTGLSGAGWDTDTDGDGVPDVADSYPMDPTRTGVEGGFYEALPFGGPVVIDPLIINTQVRTADVYFLMDTTGSMGGELTNLKTGLTAGTITAGCPGGIVGAIRCAIPDAWFGVGYHDDYPVNPYGGAGDFVYRHVLDITSDTTATQTGVNSLALHWGNDWPESQTQALWSIATGAIGTLGPYLAQRVGCPAGRWGYPCFRPGTIPIVILFTDAPYHNGPNAAYNYGSLGATLPVPTAVTGNDTIATARNAGDVTSTWVSFSGSTGALAHNYGGYCGSTTARDAVFMFNVTATRTIDVTLEGSTFDTVLAITNAAGTVIACNDDAVGLQSRLSISLTAGTYYAYVDGFGTASGNYRITLGVPVPASYPKSWVETLDALNARGVKVIVVESSGGDASAISDANALCNGTGSVDSGGLPFRFSIPWDGTGLGPAVVTAVQNLANYNRSDVRAVARDNLTTAAVDERGFVQSITAVSYPAGRCTGISGGTTFTQCLPGTNLNFQVNFNNAFVMPTAVPQVFDFTIEVIADGIYVLSTHPVRIVVPPALPTYPPSGSYSRTYDSTTRCMATERPNWHAFSWTASTPLDTRIRFDFRTAGTVAGLATAPPVGFDVPGTVSPQDLGTRLVAAGQLNNLPYLRVTATLFSSADLHTTPTLTGFETTFDCVAAM